MISFYASPRCSKLFVAPQLGRWNSKFKFWELTQLFHKKSNPMALSKWEYVKSFESEETLLPNCWAIARLDGRGFHKLAKKHNWVRPNDIRGLNLMNRAAKTVMIEYEDIILGYGQSDEYSFIFRREAAVFQRRSAKIVTTVVSKFAAAFVFYWDEYFPDIKLTYAPSFDGRMVLYPTDKNLRDYLSWRQADCHINNLYNTTFWTLVQQGNLSRNDAEKRLLGTIAADKNEILFSEFNMNYNNEPEVFRKGTVLVQNERTGRKIKRQLPTDISEQYLELPSKAGQHVTELNCDVIGEAFWTEYPYLLLGNPSPIPSKRSITPISSTSSSNTSNIVEN